MKIDQLLQGKGRDVATITATATVAQAAAALSARAVGALVVSSDGLHIEGIISERDIVRALNQDGGAVTNTLVGSIMTSTVVTCSPDDPVAALMAVMTERRCRHVPVVADDVLVGIVSIGDVVKSRIEELEHDRKDLLDYVGAR